MARYVQGSNRRQVTLLPECLDDYIAEDNPVRVVDAFVQELNLEALGFLRAEPAATGQHAYSTNSCTACAMRPQCTTGKERCVRRWEHEDVLERLQARFDRRPQQRTVRRRTIEHVFGTLDGIDPLPHAPH